MAGGRLASVFAGYRPLPPPPPPPLSFRGQATLLTPAEAAVAQAQAAGRGPPGGGLPGGGPPHPLRLTTGYSFGDERGTAFEGENYLYDGRAANQHSHANPHALTHASLITRYQPLHDLPVENRPKSKLGLM